MVVTHDVEINGLQYDSREVQNGDMFIANQRRADRRTRAYRHCRVVNGAKAVVMENRYRIVPDSFFMHAGVVKIVAESDRHPRQRTLHRAHPAADPHGVVGRRQV